MEIAAVLAMWKILRALKRMPCPAFTQFAEYAQKLERTSKAGAVAADIQGPQQQTQTPVAVVGPAGESGGQQEQGQQQQQQQQSLVDASNAVGLQASGGDAGGCAITVDAAAAGPSNLSQGASATDDMKVDDEVELVGLTKWKTDFEKYPAKVKSISFDGARITVTMLGGPKKGEKKVVTRAQVQKSVDKDGDSGEKKRPMESTAETEQQPKHQKLDDLADKLLGPVEEME